MTLKEYFYNDRFAVQMGIEIVEIREGYARVQLKIKECHLNGGDICQGGVLFTLADFACAVVANSHLFLSFSVSANIAFHNPGCLDDILTAEAQEIKDGKLPCCQVKISNQKGEIIASSTAMFYRKNIPLPVDALQ